MKNRYTLGTSLHVPDGMINTQGIQRDSIRMSVLYLFAFIFVLDLLNACRPGERDHVQKNPSATELVSVNQYLVKKDHQTITNYVQRKSWEMQTTKTGLWYMILAHGKGVKAEPGDLAEIAYSVYLLDGTLCYSSDSLGLKKFRIGQGNVESGLEEGILLLRAGDKARFIMPPHLSHGLLGDSDKIPARAIIVYELELLAIQKPGSEH